MKPMLAGKCEDVATLEFPVLVSAKLDGIRALVIGGQVLSRSLKPIPNAWVQKQFGCLPEGTDGELIYGDPTHTEAYRNTVSAVMSEDGEPAQVCYHVFDNFLSPGGFSQRYRAAEHTNDYVSGVICVPHMHIDNAEQLTRYETETVEAGYEGVMIRSLNGPYKQGRSTTKEGYLLKLKRFEDAEAIVLDTEELMHNANVATKDNLGHTERSSHKENLVGLHALGALIVRGVGGTYDGVEFNIGTGFTGAAAADGERAKLWKIRRSLVGRIVKFKYFPTGSKDRPRFPVYLGWRDPIDL